MSNLKDPNERYNRIRENIIDMLIEYDEFVREHHKNLINAAKHMTEGTPLFPEDEKDVPVERELLKRHRYLNSFVFRHAVDKLSGFIMANTKDSQ